MKRAAQQGRMALAMPIDWLDKLRFLLQVLAFALVVSAIQYIFQPERPYEVPMRYSLCISFFTWALIDFGRHHFSSSVKTGWPQGLAGVALSFGGIVLGYLMGTLVGDWWCGWPGGSFAPEAREQLQRSIIITLIAGSVATYYFYSISKSSYLETQMTEAHAQAAEARLKLLETQLEPHMMFNTLANLRVLIGIDPQAAQRMLDHMIAYLRATLGASRSSTHSLRAEFDRLQDYLELMAVRMGPRLRYTLALPEALNALPIPTLLLQPLVENCIKHGLEPKVEGGDITVQARLQDLAPPLLTLEVMDTGIGLPLLASADPDHPRESGFGLAQVRERLLTAYGTQAKLHITPREEGGTLVSIQIPLPTLSRP